MSRGERERSRDSLVRARYSRERVERAARSYPESFRGWEVVTGMVVIYDDPASAAELAGELGVTAKTAEIIRNPHLSSISIVPLPDNWSELL